MNNMMNTNDFQLSQRLNSSNANNCIESIDLNTSELLLTPNKNSNKSYDKFRNTYYSANKNNHVFKLYSRHNNSIKNCINYEKNLNLLENKLKKLAEEKRKIVNKIHNKQNIQKLKELNKENYNKRRNFLSNLLKEKEKVIEDKKDKVKKMKSQEKKRTKNIIIYRKINLQDISEEKNKINEEKKRKMNLIKILDDDIHKRKIGEEKINYLIKKEKLEKEIKIQENFNKKLAIKISEYKKIGLEKINLLEKIKLKLKNKF